MLLMFLRPDVSLFFVLDDFGLVADDASGGRRRSGLLAVVLHLCR